MSALRSLVEGKTVAIVGRAGSIVGTGNGPAIDAADVVIRVNWLLPTLEEHLPDMGERTDLVYTCLRCKTARNLAAVYHVPTARITARARLRASRHFAPKRKDYRVSTGFLCAIECKRFGAARVNLYGFDMQRSEHVQERTPDGHNPKGNKARTWWHLWDVERRAWRKFIRKSRGVVVPDEILYEALK